MPKSKHLFSDSSCSRLNEMEPTEKDVASPPVDAVEDNLSQLLDSCIDDFNKPLPKPAATQPKSLTSNAAKPKPTSSEVANVPDSAAAAWSSEFKEFSNVMENLIGDESEMEEIRKLMEGCLSQNAEVLEDDNFTNSFADTIRHLTEQAQNVPETNPEELANLLGSLDVEGGAGDLENMPELMQGVMQKLMSKELLYPSLKEIVDKYPEWLSERKSTLDTKEYEKYESQYVLMKQICEEFESECSSDSEEDKKRQFEKVLQLMQKIQSFGNPPKELVSNIGPGIPLDDQGNLQIPGMPGNCVVM